MRARLRATSRCGSVAYSTREEIRMKRIHVHVGVATLDQSISFHSESAAKTTARCFG
jgi:hypothetical protein